MASLTGAWDDVKGVAGDLDKVADPGGVFAKPAAPDLSASQQAMTSSTNLANNLAQQRQGFVPSGAPQIGANGSISAPTSGIQQRQPTASENGTGPPGTAHWSSAGQSPLPAGATYGTPTAAQFNPQPIGGTAGGIQVGNSKVNGTAPPTGIAPPGSGSGGAGYNATAGLTPAQAAAFTGQTAPAPGSATPGGGLDAALGGTPNGTTNGQLQSNALGMLQSQAAGTAPSAAQIQTQQNLGTQMANQYALASALQGRHPGAAYNAAAQGTATAQGTAAGQGALLRAQEQAQAQNTFANAAGGARGQDIQTQTANLSAQLTTMGYDEQTKNALLAAQLQAQGYDVSSANAIIQSQTQAAQSANQYKGGLISTLGSVV